VIYLPSSFKPIGLDPFLMDSEEQLVSERQNASDIASQLKAGLPLRHIGEISLAIPSQQDAVVGVVLAKAQAGFFDIAGQDQVLIAITVHISRRYGKDGRRLHFHRKRFLLDLSAAIHDKIGGSQMVGFFVSYIFQFLFAKYLF